jgi:hypothetical protein
VEDFNPDEVIAPEERMTRFIVNTKRVAEAAKYGGQLNDVRSNLRRLNQMWDDYRRGSLKPAPASQDVVAGDVPVIVFADGQKVHKIARTRPR